MKKTTPKTLSKLLAQYGALSTAILGIADVNGQIIYTDVDPDEGGPQAFYYLDLDNNGYSEFIIDHSNPFLRMFPIQSYVGPGNAVSALSYSNIFVYPNVGAFNDIISSGNASWNSNYLNMRMCSGAFGQWCNATDGYLKLRFLIGTDMHYGWARLDAQNAGTTGNWIIKDYAYNSTPDAPINAGQTTLGIEDNVFSKIKVVALNKTIGLYNLPETSQYNVYNMTGQEVLKGATNKKDVVVEASTLASGVYVVELKDTNSNGVMRKKVVLQ